MFSVFFIGNDAPAHLRTERKACMGLAIEHGPVSSPGSELQWIKSMR